jgi:lysozyme family protein
VSDFQAAVTDLIDRWEGGYVNDPSDPGRETKYGISKRSYPELDIANLTKNEAASIYLHDWWTPLLIWSVNDQAVATKMLNMAVNMGDGPAVRSWQRALNYIHDPTAVDGVMGPATLARVNQAPPDLLLEALRAYHARHYIELVEGPDPRFTKFSIDWLRRAMA